MRGNFADLPTFAQELERVEREAKDYVAPSDKLSMGGAGELRASLSDTGEVTWQPTDWCHSQVATKLSIPKRYYDRMRGEAPDLLSTNVNRWLRESDRRHLVRTIDGKARAFLSDRYRPLGNAMVMRAMLPAIEELGGQDEVKVSGLALSDTKLYVQIWFPSVEREVLQGDVIRAGVTVSNSEVGAGSLSVRGSLLRLICTNGMVGTKMVNERHVGTRLCGGDDAAIEYRADTIRAELEAFALSLRDTFAHVASATWIEEQAARMREHAEVDVANPEKTVEAVIEEVNLASWVKEPILDSMWSEPGRAGRHIGRTWWGVINGVTALGNGERYDVDVDSQHAYESAGSRLASLPPKRIKELASVV